MDGGVSDNCAYHKYADDVAHDVIRHDVDITGAGT